MSNKDERWYEQYDNISKLISKDFIEDSEIIRLIKQFIENGFDINDAPINRYDFLSLSVLYSRVRLFKYLYPFFKDRVSWSLFERVQTKVMLDLLCKYGLDPFNGVIHTSVFSADSYYKYIERYVKEYSRSSKYIIELYNHLNHLKLKKFLLENE